MKLKNINKIVNKFDKSFGINVKDIPIFDNLYKSSTVFETSVKKMICIINDINPDCMVKEDVNERCKLFTQKVKKSATKHIYTFPELSSLKWDRTCMHSIKSNIFRKRWLTLVMTDILQNSESIAKNMIDTPHSEEELSIIKLSHIQKDLEYNVLKNTYTAKMFFIELTYYIDKRKHKVMNKVAQIIDSMLDVSSNTPIKKRSEDFMLFYISTLAYMLTTNTNCNSKLKFHLIEGYRLGDDATEFIKYLGKLIAENQLSYSFNAFINASPKIYSKDESREYKIGIASLEFIRFIFNDNKYICRYIGKVID